MLPCPHSFVRMTASGPFSQIASAILSTSVSVTTFPRGSFDADVLRVFFFFSLPPFFSFVGVVLYAAESSL